MYIPFLGKKKKEEGLQGTSGTTVVQRLGPLAKELEPRTWGNGQSHWSPQSPIQ